MSSQETYKEKLALIRSRLAGRAAEYLTFGYIGTAASDDLEKAITDAYEIVAKHGMIQYDNDHLLFNMNYQHLENKPISGPSEKYFLSEKTKNCIDKNMHKIIQQEYDNAYRILQTNKNLLEKLANALLEQETLYYDNLVAILGDRNAGNDDNEILNGNDFYKFYGGYDYDDKVGKLVGATGDGKIKRFVLPEGLKHWQDCFPYC